MDVFHEAWYPNKLMVKDEGTAATYDFMASVYESGECFHYAEFGVYHGGTVKNVIQRFPNAVVHVFDFEDKIKKLKQELSGFVYFYSNSQRYNDSYNWSLIKLLERRETRPLFDYIFLDGAHTFAVDALTFFLCDKLLKVGGYIDFDDYHWTIRGSSLDPEKVPEILLQYTDEQIDSKQVEMIVDLIVRNDHRYDEIVPNKVFKKISL